MDIKQSIKTILFLLLGCTNLINAGIWRNQFENMLSDAMWSNNSKQIDLIIDMLMGAHTSYVKANVIIEVCQRNGRLDFLNSLCEKYPKVHTEVVTYLVQEHKARATQANDLSDDEKTIICDFYEQLKQNHAKSDSELLVHPVAQLSIELLKKYCLILWIKKIKALTVRSPEKKEWYNRFFSEPQKTLSQKLYENFLNISDIKILLLKDQDDFFDEKGFALDIATSEIFHKIKACEAQSQVQGYEVFYHARAWGWNFVNDMFNLIKALEQKQNELPNKISLRYRGNDCDIEKLKQYREKLMTNGISGKYLGSTARIESGKESEITCMNITIFSNSETRGDCTGKYFVANCSSVSLDMAWEFVEQLFNRTPELQDYLKYHRQDLRTLYDMHMHASRQGELLVIKVRKEAVDKMVYPATSGCDKSRTALLASQIIERIKEEANKNPNYIDTRKEFFCLAVSDIPGEQDVCSIQSINLADLEKYNEYKKQRDVLFKIMKDR